MGEHEGLYPGPEVDGRPTWFAFGENIPAEWERRGSSYGRWWITPPAIPGTLYQARPYIETIKVECLGTTKTITQDDVRKAIGYATSEAADRVWKMLTGVT